MRNRLTTATAALLLASAALTSAQQPPQAPAQPQAPASTPIVTGLNSIDFGFRGTGTSGDEARYERYRDTRNGAYTNIRFGMESERYLFGATANNIGYHDQNYTVDYQNSAVRFGFEFDAIPLNYCYNCSTPWVEGPENVWTLDPATRTAVQNSRYHLPPPAIPLPAGLVGIPSNPAQLQQTSVYEQLAQPFDLQQRRDTTGFNLSYALNTDVSLTGGFKSTHKSGYQPFGMAFAFTNANELPLHLDNRTNDVSVGLEWVRPQGMFRAGYDYSVFSNKYNSVVWDNPLQVVDYDNGLLPPAGPYDPSGTAMATGRPWGGSRRSRTAGCRSSASWACTRSPGTPRSTGRCRSSISRRTTT